MTSAEFRNALAKLRFLELPEFIDLALYHSDIASIWRDSPVRGFFQLSDDDQDKVFAAIWDDDENMEPDPEMSDRPDWDNQFAETESERNERQRAKRQLRYDKERRTITSSDPPGEMVEVKMSIQRQFNRQERLLKAQKALAAK